MESSNNIIENGICLVAEPFLSDENFFRTVIFLTAHDEEGSVGFVINKPTQEKIGHLLKNFPRPELPVFEGGPVESNTLYVIHRWGGLIPDSIAIGQGLFWGGSFDFILQKISAPDFNPSEIAFFRGYAGWGPGQLAAELSEGAWRLIHQAGHLVFPPGKTNLWQILFKHQAEPEQKNIVYPIHPSLN